MPLLIVRLVIFLWLFWLFYGPTAYLQNALFATVFVDEGGMKAIAAAILLLFGLYLAWHGSRAQVSDVTLVTASFLFITMLLAPSALVAFDGAASSAGLDTWYAALRTYAVLPLFIVVDVVRWDMTSGLCRSISRIVFALYMPFFGLALFQFLANAPILPVKFPGEGGFSDGTLYVYGGFFMGEQIRAFSFTSSPLDFGIMSLFVLCLSLSTMISARLQPVQSATIVVLCASLIGVMLTLTRSLALNAVFGVAMLLLLGTGQGRGPRPLIRYYPYICVGLLLCVVIAFPFLPGIHRLNESYLDSSSLVARLGYWAELLKDISANTAKVLYGNGQPQAQGSEVGMVYDNTVVAILAMSGVPALLGFILLYDRVYIRVLNEFYAAEHGRRGFVGAAAAFLACFPGLSMFNNLVQGAMLFLIPALLAAKRSSKVRTLHAQP